VEVTVESISQIGAEWADHWVTGDVHVHADGCTRPSDPTFDVIRGEMRNGHVQLVEVLRWGHEIFEILQSGRNFARPTTDPPPGGGARIYEGFETSGIPAGTTGHLIGLDPVLDRSTDHFFEERRSTVLLADDLHAASPTTVFGLAHMSGFDLLTTHYQDTGEPFELPVHAARGLLSFVSVEGMPMTTGVSLQPEAWALLMNVGVHVALTAGVDYPCWVQDLGSARTLARVPDPGALDHAQFLDAIRARRIAMVDRSDDRLEFDLGVPAAADTVALPADGAARIHLRWRTTSAVRARLWLNGVVLQTVDLPAGSLSGELPVRLPASGWIVITTAHTISSATWVELEGHPFVPSLDAACALALSTRLITQMVRSGRRNLGTDTADALLTYDAALEHFEALARQARPTGCM